MKPKPKPKRASKTNNIVIEDVRLRNVAELVPQGVTSEPVEDIKSVEPVEEPVKPKNIKTLEMVECDKCNKK